ncbi:MAG: hypothetical protein ABIK37_00605 [candidate division WOR-3 bacterium]
MKWLGSSIIIVLSLVMLASAGWRAMPLSLIQEDDDTMRLAANNGWCITKSLDCDGHPGRLRVVYTQRYYDKLKVYTERSDPPWASWGSRMEISETRGAGDSAFDAVISCLGDTVAVVFYDDWTDNDTTPRQIAYTQSLEGGSGNSWSEPLVVSDDDDQHVWTRHPSVAVTWKPPSQNEPGPVAYVVWTDSLCYRLSDDARLWMTVTQFNTVDMEPFDVGCEDDIDDDIQPYPDFPSVCWNRARVVDDIAWTAFQAKDPGEIYCNRAVYAGVSTGARSVTGGWTGYDQRPCIQCTYGDPDGYYTKDTVVIAWQRRRTGETWRVMLARGYDHQDDGEMEFDTFEPAQLKQWRAKYGYPNCQAPNLWHYHRDAQPVAKDSQFMVLMAEGPDADLMMPLFTWSTRPQCGVNWAPPVRVAGAYFRDASLFAHGDSAYIVALHHIPGSNRWRVYCLRLAYMAAIDRQWLATANTARALQSTGANAGFICRGFGTGSFVATDRTLDGGETWEDIGSPGFGTQQGFALGADSILLAAFVRDDSLFCNCWNGEGDWNWGDEKLVFAPPAGVQLGQPSVALYPGKVNGVKVAAVTFCVYDPVQGRSQVLWAKVDTGSVILDTIAGWSTSGDSFPCINVFCSDTLVVTWQQNGGVKQTMLCDYPAGSGSQPPAWSQPYQVAGSGFHPMSSVEGTILTCVWTDTAQGEDEVAVCKRACDLVSQVGSWGATTNASGLCPAPKDNAVYAGCGVTCWEEQV